MSNPPTVPVDMEAFGKDWHLVEMYKAVFGHLPQINDTDYTEKELAREFLKKWDEDSSRYSASLYFLAKEILAGRGGTGVDGG